MPKNKAKPPTEAPWRQHRENRRDDEQAGRGSGNGWNVWHGAWRSTNSPNAAERGKPFPTYDRKWQPEPPIRVVSEHRHAEPSRTTESASRKVQQCVNLLRKAETKVGKIARDQQEKANRFADYERQLMASFLVEKQKHAEYQEKLAKDLEEARQQVLEAKTTLAKSVAEATSLNEDASMEPTTQGEAEWAEMVQRHSGTPVVPPQMDPEVIALLRLYKSGAIPPPGPGSAAPHMTGGAPMMGPLSHQHGPPGLGQDMASGQKAAPPPEPAMSTGVPEGPPAMPTYGAASPGGDKASRVAPYQQTSPMPVRHGEQAPAEVKEPVTTPLPPTPSTAEGEASKLQTREGVKALPHQTPVRTPIPSTTLQDKLEHKRATDPLGPALQPFRGGHVSQAAAMAAYAEVMAARSHPQGGNAQVSKTTIVQDDDPDTQHMSASPGLTKLE
ncbi:Pp1-87B [Symbiodinium sp. CCMP2592]|nr:Pp1-87B [Symbiodinium sp. CCMP2592]